MNTENIFKLLNKFSKEEDQLSAGFGFILKQYPKILKKFLSHIAIPINSINIKEVDMETLAPYNSGKSIIDLQITIPGQLLIFIESKIVSTRAEKVVSQLKKYEKILHDKRAEYAKGVKLVYISKNQLDPAKIDMLEKEFKLLKRDFYYFSWNDLLKLTVDFQKKEIIKLFNNYIGDSMYNKKIIKEQKLKDVVDVLVIFTNPPFWNLTVMKNIAVQHNPAPDAHYIAFLRIRRPDKKRSAITHVAEVEYTEMNVPRRTSLKGLDSETARKLKEHLAKRDLDLEELHKQYILKKGSLVKLEREIEHYGSGPMVNFRTTMSELLRAKTTREMKKGRNI